MSAIAIVGMGCRFAGARDLHEYWELTREGRHAFSEPPADRWNHEVFFSTSRRATDTSYAPKGGFIQDVKSFPALALGLPPRRVEVMDPQQRFVLESAMQAIEDAGGDVPYRTGVFVGVTAIEWRSLMATRIMARLMAAGDLGEAPADPVAIAESVENVVPSRPFSAPGVLGNMNAATIAQELDLHGPAFSVDAACASALIAVNNAITQLRTGQIDAALAGGVYLCLTPEHHVAFSRIGAMSASGEARPFDARADGFVQGDGAGMILLKRLEDAQRDGDRVYAVLHGAAYNNDGRGDGPMAPVQAGQTDCIELAWKDAGVDPAQLGYVETHGTGTGVGDITEFNGLMDAIGGQVKHAALGSSKANVGHTMSAAGIAGVIRAALAIHHQTIPPMAGFESPKPDLPIDGSPFHIPTSCEAWEGPNRLAGVSSFGFGGTNAHVVLGSVDSATEVPAQAELVLMSAPDEPKLRDLAKRTAAAIAADPTITVAGVARAWALRRHQPARLGVVATSREELITALEGIGAGEYPAGAQIGTADGEVKLAYLYPGQGAQRTGMLADIKQRFGVVSETLDAIESELDGELALPLTHLIYPELRETAVDEDTASAELTATENCQPALLSTGMALTALLDTVGVKPTVVVGHSLGEFTAAAAGGVLSAADAARFVARRGKAMADLAGDPGTMAAVMAEREIVEQLLVDGAVIANVNHPRQIVVSGATEAVKQVVANAEAKEVKAKLLTVSHGFHSPALAGLDTDGIVDALELSNPSVTVASGIADRPYRDATDARDVFRRHAVSPVDFVQALAQCREAGANLFLQVGAGGPLAAFARGAMDRDHKGIVSLAGMNDHDGGASLLEALARLYIAGVNVDVRPITAQAPLASVPPVVLPREEYWAIKDEPQLALNLQGLNAEPRERKERPVTAKNVEAPAVEEPVAADGDPIEEKVLGIVAKVSAYPRAALRVDMALVDDLGFDSLMVGDLATGLAEAFPGIGGIPQEMLINRPTVQDLVDFARGQGQGGNVDVDDDAPLTAYAPVWRPTPLPAETRELQWPVYTEHAGLAAMLDAEGIARTDDLAKAKTVLVQLGTAPSVQAVAEGTPWPDTAAPVIAIADALAKANRSADLFVLGGTDPWAEGAFGAVRAIAREWPTQVVKALHVDGALDADRLLAELRSADVSVDVRLTAEGRDVLGLEPAADEVTWTPSDKDTVLITGGTRGLGARIAKQMVDAGAQVVLVGRGSPGAEAQALIDASEGRAVAIAADVTDKDALLAAATPHGPYTAVVHSAGVLADGALGQVDAARGEKARKVKVDGWLNAIAAAPEATVAFGLGSWAGRFGNRHQAHYAAANSLLAALTQGFAGRAVVGEFGPWTGTEMVDTIPAPVQAAMRSEGIDFVGPEAGAAAIATLMGGASGTRVLGRDLTRTLRSFAWTETLSTETHPFLLDHAVQGVPVLPLASATDLLAWGAGVHAPFEIVDLRLFQGITVREPTRIRVRVDGESASITVGERDALAYKARVRRIDGDYDDPGMLTDGAEPMMSLADFYDGKTFHGPLLQGITRIDAVSEDFVRGKVRIGQPREWIPGTRREAWSVDPLAMDSAMQLSAYVAWLRYGRAGTPVGLGRYVQLAPLPASGEIVAEVTFGEAEDNRFTGTLWLRALDGTLLAVAEDVVAELRKVEDGAEDEDEDDFEVKPEWVDPSTWPAYKDLMQRLTMAEMVGIKNPYFTVHEGTARNVTSVEGRELVNYSSYNYLGLSGEPEVLAATREAVDKYGTSVSASRVASGERPFHQELEAKLAKAQDTEDSLLFTAGHATNVTTIGHLFGPEDLIMHDELIHDSALQGIKLSGASRRAFKHDDPANLEAQLKQLRKHYQKVLIVVEGVYSMDGDICDVPAYIALKKKYGCMLMVDEAHSFGVVGATGCGVREHFGFPGTDVDIWMGTLSKSLASCGGWIAAKKDLVTYLRYTAPGFVYSAGLTPANGMAALKALDKMLDEPERVQTLQDNAQYFHDELVKRGLDTGPALGGSAVIPVVTGNSMHALMLSQRLVEQGINVQPIVYPAVADDAARLRFFLSSTHTREQLLWTAQTVADTLASVRADFAV
ncbi:MAG: aminotransferase class I/II-fold pyridoxal phosphate-dependent enzyme [Deltaproteobacteria bacterium]|nr:MAG: aminotransferase class I/II-fold pyridoxal phosphate-dependent enzyme [Deltaproteobacteria bacterium]